MSEMLLKYLDLMATAPDGVARLRELILTLAVQGKLVPQDPNDEPASVLLQKIRVEKDRLIAEGKIRRDKPLPPIADEEKPFELPLGWEWVRLPDIYFSISPSTNKLLSSAVKPEGQYPVVDQGQKHVTGFTDDAGLLIKIPGPVIVFGDHTKAIKYIDFDFVAGADGTKILRPIHQDEKFFAWQLRSFSLEDRGYARHFKVLNTCLFALPPKAEQARIVARVEELMHLCDALEAKVQLDATQYAQLLHTLLGTLTDSATPEELGTNWQRVAAHFDLLLDRPEAVDALEQNILQLAVRGLLVPQDPADEPASVLLQRIHAEKDRLIAEGKIKRDKPLRPITDEEKPFELPMGWEWSTLATVGVINPRNDASDDTVASFVQMSSIPVAFTEPHLVESRPWREIKSGFTQFAEGDVGVAKITPCFENGKSTVFQSLSNGIGAGTTELHIVRPLGGISPRYVLLFLKTPGFLIGGEGVMTGSAGHKRLPRAYFENKPFPLPPLNEQSRIVARVEELIQLCNDLRQRLIDKRTTQRHLAEALVEDLAA